MRGIVGSILAAVMVLALSGVSMPQSAERSDADSVKEKLIGAWRLAWEEEQGADGKMNHIVDQQGTIVYTRDGHMSVQIMLPSTDGPRDVNNPVKYDQGGYEAYYGSYEVNEQAHTVTHHVQGALVRALVGKDLTRVYRFSNGQLILKSSRPDEHWTIAWEHY
jgi:lipocalin-like protein